MGRLEEVVQLDNVLVSGGNAFQHCDLVSDHVLSAQQELFVQHLAGEVLPGLYGVRCDPEFVLGETHLDVNTFFHHSTVSGQSGLNYVNSASY